MEEIIFFILLVDNNRFHYKIKYLIIEMSECKEKKIFFTRIIVNSNLFYSFVNRIYN